MVVTPHRPVYLTRWKVVVAFLLIAGIAVATAVWNDYRIDQAERRIRANTASNEQQNAVRAELVAGFRAQDVRFCMFINDLRAQNRLDAHRDFAQLDRNLRLLGVAKTPEIVEVATENRDRILARNQEVKC